LKAAVNRKFNPIPPAPAQQHIPYVPENEYVGNDFNPMAFYDDDIEYSQYK
jgi:hypothetical protein